MKYLIIITILLSLSLNSNAQFYSENGHFFEIQFLSKSYIDSTIFYGFCDTFEYKIDKIERNIVYYRYYILPKKTTYYSALIALKCVKRRYADAFIVKYINGKRIN